MQKRVDYQPLRAVIASKESKVGRFEKSPESWLKKGKGERKGKQEDNKTLSLLMHWKIV